MSEQEPKQNQEQNENQELNKDNIISVKANMEVDSASINPSINVNTMEKKKPLWAAVIAFFAFSIFSLGIGFGIGQTVETGESSWYQQLNPPVIKPPNWLFAPVWSVMYFLMGLGGFFLWNHYREFSKEHWKHWVFYFVQSLLNFAWTPIFFSARSLLGGSIEIIFLWFAILMTIILFWRVKWYYGAVLIPYIMWVTFATALSWSFYSLNN